MLLGLSIRPRIFGVTRRFETRDLSTNSWWVAPLTLGEGWHNNHHAHPVSARHGLDWYEIDVNWYGIWLLAKLGFASHVSCAKLPVRSDAYKTFAAPSRDGLE
jgi:fatty-acid desaturase